MFTQFVQKFFIHMPEPLSLKPWQFANTDTASTETSACHRLIPPHLFRRSSSNMSTIFNLMPRFVNYVLMLTQRQTKSCGQRQGYRPGVLNAALSYLTNESKTRPQFGSPKMENCALTTKVAAARTQKSLDMFASLHTLRFYGGPHPTPIGTNIGIISLK